MQLEVQLTFKKIKLEQYIQVKLNLKYKFKTAQFKINF